MCWGRGSSETNRSTSRIASKDKHINNSNNKTLKLEAQVQGSTLEINGTLETGRRFSPVGHPSQKLLGKVRMDCGFQKNMGIIMTNATVMVRKSVCDSSILCPLNVKRSSRLTFLENSEPLMMDCSVLGSI